MDASINSIGGFDHTTPNSDKELPVMGVSIRRRVLPSQLRDRLLAQFGSERFSDAPELKSRYAKSTLPTSTTPIGIVWPENRDEVSLLMRLMSQYSIPWHAISRGKNWGYGDACAPHDGYLIVDLRRMNQIIEINERLAYAVIEPGVTQGQLAEELINQDSSLMLDVTGAGPDASIVGNVLQRGFGHTPYGDRTANSCCYEAVLPDGEVIYTGFGNVSQSNVGHVYPYGSGPNSQGMLAQNNAAIVTRMTIWLMPRPEVVEGFAFKTDDNAAFEQIVDRIARLRQSGTIDSVVHLANDLRVVSSQPWMNEFAGHAGAFTREQREYFRSRAGVANWNALGGIYGSKNIVAAKKNEIRKALKGLCRPRFFSRRLVRVMNATMRRMPNIASADRLRNLTAAVTDVYDLLNGRPTAEHLEGAFFRNRPVTGDVIDAGLIWLAPVVPFTGEDVSRLMSHVEPIANRHGFDLPITISPVVPRAAVCIANLSFRKSNSQEAKRAAECYSEIRSRISELGYPPYRNASLSPNPVAPLTDLSRGE